MTAVLDYYFTTSGLVTDLDAVHEEVVTWFLGHTPDTDKVLYDSRFIGAENATYTEFDSIQWNVRKMQTYNAEVGYYDAMHVHIRDPDVSLQFKIVFPYFQKIN